MKKFFGWFLLIQLFVVVMLCSLYLAHIEGSFIYLLCISEIIINISFLFILLLYIAIGLIMDES